MVIFQKIKLLIIIVALSLSVFSLGKANGDYIKDSERNLLELLPANPRTGGSNKESLDVPGKLQADGFVENLSRRTQTSRHFYNEFNTHRFVSAHNVRLPGIHSETDWVTKEEYPISYVLRLQNGSQFKSQNSTEFSTLWQGFSNSSIFGLGIESHAGVLAFYLDFTDADWGHGQYLYYPRLKNGKISDFNQPLYGIYPRLFVKAGGSWFDTLLNNQSFYSDANDPRDNLIITQTDDITTIKFVTDLVDIGGFNWNVTQGFKYNSSDQQFHMITRINSLDRGWQNVGFGYEITVSPQAIGTNYEPENFILFNENNSKTINITNLWLANETITNPLNKIEIVSENGEGFIFDFQDMTNAGFNKSYLELHNQILPNGVSRKSLLAGMFNYGSYTQGTEIQIDPSFAEKLSTDEDDFYVKKDETDTYTIDIGFDQTIAGFRPDANDVFRTFNSWNTTISDSIATIENITFTFFVDQEYVEAGEFIAGGLFHNSSLIQGAWNETFASSNVAGAYEQSLYYIDNEFYDFDGTFENQTMTAANTTALLEAWRTHHNSDPSNRQFFNFQFRNGTNLDLGNADRVFLWESTAAVENRRPTLSFDYVLAADDSPEIDSPPNQTLEAGYNGQNITWTPTERTNGNDTYLIFRNGTQVESGGWSNQTAIVFDLDPYNLSLGVWNYTISINDTLNVVSTDTVLITVTDTVSPILDSPADVTYTFGDTGNVIAWTATDFLAMNYTIFRNGTDILNGSWVSATPININVDGLAVGDYNYTILVNDTSNNMASDQVIVIVNAVPGAGVATGDFVIPAVRDYYPETVLILQIVNLTLNGYFGVLIGVNQKTGDQQWDNFTATSVKMNRSIIHFNTQTYLDDADKELDHLLIYLYLVVVDTNTTPELLSRIRYNLVRISDQLNPIFLGYVIAIGITFLVLFTILMSIFKMLYKNIQN